MDNYSPLKNIIMKFNLLVPAIALALTSNAQIGNIVKSAIMNNETNLSDKSKLLETKNSDSVFYMLDLYRTSEIEGIRNKAYKLLVKIGRFCKDSLYKRKCIEKVVLSQFDSSEYIRNGVCEDIIEFRRKDFNSVARRTLENFSSLKNKNLITYKNILLIGFLEIRVPHIEDLAKIEIEDKTDLTFNIIWNSKLCLARMGKKDMIVECIRIMRKTNTDNLSYIANCGYSGYIRSSEAIKFLNELLESNLLMPTSPKKAMFNGEPYASHALYAISSCIKNIPFKNKCETCYSMDEIIEARKWMKKNRNNYIINTENF